jgi:flavodoxin II
MNAKPIGLFYGSSTCYTQMAAEKIAACLGEKRVDVYNIADEPLLRANQYSHLIFGIPTWDYGELQEDWENLWDELDSLQLEGKPVALFGLGDQVGYPEWFLDALGYLHAKLVKQGALPCGYWPVAGYTFEASQALTPEGTHFVGLALDEETQFDRTAERIQTWCAGLLADWQLT